MAELGHRNLETCMALALPSGQQGERPSTLPCFPTGRGAQSGHQERHNSSFEDGTTLCKSPKKPVSLGKGENLEWQDHEAELSLTTRVQWTSSDGRLLCRKVSEEGKDLHR